MELEVLRATGPADPPVTGVGVGVGVPPTTTPVPHTQPASTTSVVVGMTPPSVVQQLDDGYGSSNSSPHSSGMLSTSCGPVSRQKQVGTPLHRSTLSCQRQHPDIQKKDIQVELHGNQAYRSFVVPSSSPSPEDINGTLAEEVNDSDSESATEDVAILEVGDGACHTGSVVAVSLGGGGGAGGTGRKRTARSLKQIQDDPERETWGRNADFLLSIIGFAVDLANVWRFPYLCYKNGGGAFLIPYTIMLVFGAVPLFYMELILGQYNRQGPVSVWRVCPVFKGVGFCAVMVAFYVSFYYNVIIGWALYFMVASAAAELPWLHCNNTWNTDGCWESPSLSDTNASAAAADIAASSASAIANATLTKLHHSPAAEYFHRGVLEMSEGLHDLGAPKWQLVVCVFLVYCMLYLSLFKGVKSSGLVVWVTATMPYVVLTILLVRGLMLPGALTGITYYLKPELSRLAETQVWVDAAVQIFFSVGAGFGVHLSYASYNHFDNNCYNDCLITTAVNCFTSFFSGFVIFTYLGFMSYKQGIHISSVATEGPGLVFQVYPEAVATLPGSHFWSMLFFFMLIMLGLDSAMGGMECVITGLMDEFHFFFHGRRYAREAFTFCAIAVSFCVALINVTPGGIYMFHLFDSYSAGIALLCSALFEAVAVSWFYGLERFSQDVHDMLGFTPGLYWRICWKFISPMCLIGVVMFGLLYHQPLEYGDYKYPSWAEGLGWCLALSSIIMIPVVAIIRIIRTPGTFKERVAVNISPSEEHDEIRRTGYVSRFKCKHWLYV